MRLLEPLSGIKTAQGHALVHLIFFVTMLFINTDAVVEHPANSEEWVEELIKKGMLPNPNAKPMGEEGGEGGEEFVQYGNEIFLLTNVHMNKHDVALYKENELYAFNMLKWGHLVTFVG